MAMRNNGMFLDLQDASGKIQVFCHKDSMGAEELSKLELYDIGDIVGAHGTILLSEDAGATWKQAAVPVAADLTTVRFTGPGVAWALGHDGVALRSVDRGATWSKVLDGRTLLALLNNHYRGLAARGDAGAVAVLDEVKRAAAQSATPDVLSYPFLDISIDAGGEGFLAGAFGLLLHTRDGGKSWEPWLERADNDRRMHLYALERAPDGVFYLAGEQGLLRRYDRAAGRFAKLESPYTGTFFGLKAGDAGLAAFGLRGSAFVSADGGTSWKQVALGTEATVVDAVACAPGEMAFVTQDGRVLLGRKPLRVEPQLGADPDPVFDMIAPRAGGVWVDQDRKAAVVEHQPRHQPIEQCYLERDLEHR